MMYFYILKIFQIYCLMLFTKYFINKYKYTIFFIYVRKKYWISELCKPAEKLFWKETFGEIPNLATN